MANYVSQFKMTNNVVAKVRDTDAHTLISNLTTKVNKLLYDKADIRNYGGVADGSTDCTTAFNNCLSENNVVYLPNYNNNSYVIGSVNLTGSSEIIGDEGTEIKYNGTNYLFNISSSKIKISNLYITCTNNGNVFNLNNSIGIEYIYLSDITVNGAINLITDINATANITNMYLNRITSRNHKGNGVSLRHCVAFTFLTDVTIDYVGNVGNARAFEFYNNAGMHLLRCEAEGGASDGTHTQHIGFIFYNCQAVWLERCMADTLDSIGFELGDAKCSYFRFDNCIASLCFSHGFLLRGNNIQICNSSVNGRNNMSIKSSGAHGIWNFGDNVTITGTLLYNNTGYGLLIGGGIGVNVGTTNINDNGLTPMFIDSSAWGLIHDCMILRNASNTVGGSSDHLKYYNLYDGITMISNL